MTRRHEPPPSVSWLESRWPGFRPLTLAERRSGLPAASEERFQAGVVNHATLCGWLSYHTYDSRRSGAGFPDLVLVRRDRVVFVELKGSETRVTPSQVEWLVALDRAGREVHVWRSGRTTMDDVHAALR